MYTDDWFRGLGFAKKENLLGKSEARVGTKTKAIFQSGRIGAYMNNKINCYLFMIVSNS